MKRRMDHWRQKAHQVVQTGLTGAEKLKKMNKRRDQILIGAAAVSVLSLVIVVGASQMKTPRGPESAPVSAVQPNEAPSSAPKDSTSDKIKTTLDRLSREMEEFRAAFERPQPKRVTTDDTDKINKDLGKLAEFETQKMEY